MGQPVETCVVCGEAVDETNSAVCQGCNGRYHLVLGQGEQGKDCGDVWINEAFMSLQFACFNCLRGAGIDSAPSMASAPAAPPTSARRSRSRRRYHER
jgi:hypothetical protein